MKVIILLVFLIILKIPIYFASEIGSSIFKIGVEPFSSIFPWIWKGLIEIVYLGICVLLIVKLIKDYSNNNEKSKVKNNKKEEIKISKKETKKSDTFETIVLILFRLFIIFVIVIPLVFIAFLLIIGLIILTYLIIKGIGVYGFLITILGGLSFIICIIDLIYRGLIVNKKIYLFPFLISILLVVIGGVISLSYIFSFEYHNYLPQNNYKTKTETFIEDINQKTNISNYEKEIIIDNNIEDNKIKMEVTYYPEFIDIEKHEDKDSNKNYVAFISQEKDISFSLNNKYTKMIIEDIKNKELYNYSEFNLVKVKIYVNENTKDLVES